MGGAGPSAPRWIVDVRVGPLPLGRACLNVSLPGGLKFNWGQSARVCLAFEELRELGKPRADVMRLLAIVANDEVGGSVAFERYAPAGPFFVVPDGLPCDRTFVCEPREVIYVDAAAASVAGLIPYAWPLSVMPQDVVGVFPERWTKERERLVQAVDSVRCVFSVLMTVRDWAVARSGKDPYRVSRETEFRPGLSPKLYPPREWMDGLEPPLGLIVPFPRILEYFGRSGGFFPGAVAAFDSGG